MDMKSGLSHCGRAYTYSTNIVQKCSCSAYHNHLLPFKQLKANIDRYNSYITSEARNDYINKRLNDDPFVTEDQRSVAKSESDDTFDNMLLSEMSKDDSKGCIFCAVIDRLLWYIIIQERQPYYQSYKNETPFCCFNFSIQRGGDLGFNQKKHTTTSFSNPFTLNIKNGNNHQHLIDTGLTDPFCASHPTVIDKLNKRKLTEERGFGATTLVTCRISPFIGKTNQNQKRGESYCKTLSMCYTKFTQFMDDYWESPVQFLVKTNIIDYYRLGKLDKTQCVACGADHTTDHFCLRMQPIFIRVIIHVMVIIFKMALKSASVQYPNLLKKISCLIQFYLKILFPYDKVVEGYDDYLIKWMN
jgi:hypothetical protein